jgi:hypothetical protein
MRKWAPGLIVFGLFSAAIGLATLVVIWKLVLLPSWHPDYATAKLERMFLRPDPGYVAWPALVAAVCGFVFLACGVIVLLRKDEQ